jgi:hypothetical protein
MVSTGDGLAVEYPTMLAAGMGVRGPYSIGPTWPMLQVVADPVVAAPVPVPLAVQNANAPPAMPSVSAAVTPTTTIRFVLLILRKRFMCCSYSLNGWMDY